MRALWATLTCPALAVVAGVLALGMSPATAAAAPGECPTIKPVDEISAGMTGTGWTVSQGRDIEPFDVEVLGVLADGVGPGRDIIVVDTSSAAIDAAGGIWFGMSGSPVMIGGEFAGVVAFGFSAGPSPIAGLTPAEDIEKIAHLPGAAAALRAPARVRVPRAMVQRIAARTGLSVAQLGTSLERLRTPLSVSGLNDRGMARLARVVADERLPLMPYRGAAGSLTAAADADPLAAGSTFVAALSYGDVTFAGTGTTSYVCDEVALAFGHPFNWTGPTTMGASAGDTIGVIADPLFGAFKMANVAETVGIVTQDRLAGLGATLGVDPEAAPVTSSVTALDTGATREGRSEVVMQDVMPFLTFIHMFSNIDTTYDRIGPGTAAQSWTIVGTRADGRPFQLRRTNLYASRFDISFESQFELLFHLDLLAANEFEDVELSSVDVDTEVDAPVREVRIRALEASFNGVRYFPVKGELAAPRGRLLYLRVLVKRFGQPGLVPVDLTIRTPRRGREAELELGGGSSLEGELCFFADECEESPNSIDSFDELLDVLRKQRRNNALFAQMRAGSDFQVKTRSVALLDDVVLGRKFVLVQLF